MFKEVGEPNFPKLEEEVLAFWKREKIFQKKLNSRQIQSTNKLQLLKKLCIKPKPKAARMC